MPGVGGPLLALYCLGARTASPFSGDKIFPAHARPLLFGLFLLGTVSLVLD